MFAHVIPGRGLDFDWPAQQVSNNIATLGYMDAVDCLDRGVLYNTCAFVFFPKHVAMHVLLVA